MGCDGSMPKQGEQIDGAKASQKARGPCFWAELGLAFFPLLVSWQNSKGRLCCSSFCWNFVRGFCFVKSGKAQKIRRGTREKKICSGLKLRPVFGRRCIPSLVAMPLPFQVVNKRQSRSSITAVLAGATPRQSPRTAAGRRLRVPTERAPMFTVVPLVRTTPYCLEREDEIPARPSFSG